MTWNPWDVVGADQLSAKWKFLDHVIDEVDGADLILLLVNFERPDPRRVVNRGILISPAPGAVPSLENQERDVDLNVMAGSLLAIMLGARLAKPRSPREPGDAIAFANALNAGAGDFDAMMARQMSDDPRRREMIFFPNTEDFLDHFGRRLARVSRRSLRGVETSGIAA